MADLSGQRIAVVGINYAPEHAGVAPYTTNACEHFAREGAEVEVLTGVPHYPHWTVPGEYKWKLRTPETHAGVSVQRLRHFVPRSQNALSRAAYEASFAANVRVQRLPWQPTVVMAVVPSLLAAFSAARLAARHDARLVIWVQDLMGQACAQSGMAGGSQVSGLTGALERSVLRRADRVIVINEAFRSHLVGRGLSPDKVSVVRNWSHVDPPRGDRRSTRRRLGWRDDQVIALHSGNMGLKQGLENVVEAAREASSQQPHVRFVLMGDGSQRAELETLGKDVAGLEFLPPAPNDEFADVLAAADVLLVNERASAVDMSLPSKLTSYLRTGAPVLAAVPSGGGTATEVARSGAGLVVTPEEPQALLDGVVGISQHPEVLERFRASARDYVARHLSAEGALGQLTEALTTDGFDPYPQDAPTPGRQRVQQTDRETVA